MTKHRAPSRFPWLALWAVAAILSTLATGNQQPALAQGHPAFVKAPASQPAQRTLVFVVHGTVILPQPPWYQVLPGQATFASELQRGLRAVDAIRTFKWSGNDDQAVREKAAADLADLIDKEAAHGERVVLVGHSHGGNIILRAAGMCHARIDTAICLATPHLCVESQAPDGARFCLPGCCTWVARQNIKTLLNVYPTDDSLVMYLAELVKGMADEEANDIRLRSESWRDHLQHDANLLLADPRSLAISEGSPIKVLERLSIADANLCVQSLVATDIGRQHWHVHSRRMGFVIGEVLHEQCSAEALAYLRTLVQPSDADLGEPVTTQEEQAWEASHLGSRRRIGWRLDRADVKLLANSEPRLPGELAAAPNIALRIIANDDNGKPQSSLSPFAQHTRQAGFAATTIIRRTESFQLGVEAEHVGGNLNLGTCRLTLGDTPPVTIEADPAQGILWSATLTWSAVHY